MKNTLLILSLLLISSSVFSQAESEKKEVEIIHADKLQFLKDKDGKSVRKLVGNVQLKQDSTFMYCDSAFLLKEENMVDMYGHVKITDGDSITVLSDELNYDGNSKEAKLIGNAQLTDNKMVLTSDILYYDRSANIGYYLTGGKLVNDNTELTSVKGYYHSNTDEAFFNEDVVIVDSSYNLKSDTLMFNTTTKVAEFYGNTTIYNEESTINCNNGTYDTENQIATFGYGTTIYNEPQNLYADSLYYDKDNGYGKAMKNFIWYDEEMKVGMEGEIAEYFEFDKTIIAINRPLLNAEIDLDTLYLRGDTVIASNSETKNFTAFKNVRIFKYDLQGVCDSMYYTSTDSILKLFQNPILWNEESEMKSDTIHATTKNSKIDRINFINNSFIVTQSSGKLFDQVKGKWITAYFRDSKLHKMLVKRNAESLYFGKDDEDNYMGGNTSKSAKMWIYIKKSKIDKIVFLEQPEAVFTPLSQMTNTMLYLKDFKVNFELRPKSKEEL